MNKKIKYNRNVSSVAMSKSPYQSGINALIELKIEIKDGV